MHRPHMRSLRQRVRRGRSRNYQEILGKTIFKKERTKAMSAGKTLIGFGIAMAAGAILGVLFAPGKGSTTRKKLSKQGSRYVDALEHTAGEYLETLEKKLDSVKEAAVGLPDKVKDAVDILAGHEPEKH